MPLFTGLATFLTYIYYNQISILPKSFNFKIINWDTNLSLSNVKTITLIRNISAWGKGNENHITNHILLSNEECQDKLIKNQKTYKVNRFKNPIIKIETNSIEANFKSEDEISIDFLTKSNIENLRKDGHGGGQTSSLLKKTLHGTLAWGLSGLKEWNSKEIYQKIKETYLALDNDICRAGLSVAQSKSTSQDTILPTPNPSLLSLIPNAGAVTCTAFIDVEKEKLYLINVGDSRAVAGWYDEKTCKWRVDTLSQDQECGNPAEIERLQNMHSPPLKDVVLDEGFTPRLLGNLQPSRAFGDDSSKLNRAEKKSIAEAGQLTPMPEESLFTKKPISYDDPPYMDACPEILIRNLRNNENPNEKLKFLIIATDGLWDKISSEESILLLSAHLSNSIQNPIPKSKLPNMFSQIDNFDERPYPSEELPGTIEKNSKGNWLFEDKNSATHLIRNGLDGNGDKEIHNMILSLTGSGAREVRDDTSVM
ncbi:uncharacterized protein I206_104620 [Kwoniella pini CBS 10737]|uniref:PPM-type phosphatase domain-containing protein n=1 Tax=Kwoniella pini CBS 10737 TaxID=1296096 RepID=A0AAJ8MR00_9TREE